MTSKVQGNGYSESQKGASNSKINIPNCEKIRRIVREVNSSNKREFPINGLFGPLIAAILIGRDCKKNRDKHLGNESTHSDGTATKNPERNKMGIGERLGLFPIEKEYVEVGGKTVEVTYYPRIGEKSAAEITSGPKELVGMVIENLNCHQTDWKDQANSSLQDKVSKLQQQNQKPPQSINLLDSFGLEDQTQNQQIELIDANIAQARKNKDAVHSDPRSTQKQCQEAVQQVTFALDKKIDKEGIVIPEDGIIGLFLSRLETKEMEARNKANEGKKHFEQADQINQLIQHHDNKGKTLQIKLEQNPNASEITVTLPTGETKVIPVKKAKHKVEKIKRKNDLHKEKQSQHQLDGLKKAAPHRAKEKMIGEARNQAQNLGQTVKVGGIFNAADAVMDVLEGKSDVKTAAANAAIGTITSTATQVVSSVVYEGVKGVIKDACPNVAESIPGLGETMVILNAGYTYYNAETREEGLLKLGEMSLNMGGEFAATGVVAVIVGVTGVSTGGLAIPIAIAGKASWRAVKYGYNHFFSSSANTINNENLS